MKKLLFALLIIASSAALSGQSWTPMAAGLLPDNFIVYSISAVGDKVVWAIASGQFNGPPIPMTHHPIILRSSDGGLTWALHEVEEAAGTIVFRIVAEDSLTAWISTQDYGGGPGRSLFKTTDGGVVWTQKLTAGGSGVALNQFSDGQHWLAHNLYGLSRSENYGMDWTADTVQGYQTDEFQLLFSGTNMSSTIGDTLWNGTSAGRIVRFTDFGQSYSFVNTGLGTSSIILSVAFGDHLNGLLYYSGPSGLSKIAKSTDGGETWANVPQQPGLGAWNITAVPGAPGVYALSTNTGTITGKVAITKDFGATWEVETIGKRLNAITFTSPSTGWVGAGRTTSPANAALYKYTGAPLVGLFSGRELDAKVTLGPNPVIDLLEVQIEVAEPVEFMLLVHDIQGRLIAQKNTLQTAQANVQFDLSNLPVGMYTLTVSSAKGHLARSIAKQ